MRYPSALLVHRILQVWESREDGVLSAALSAVIDAISVASAAYHLEEVAKRYASLSSDKGDEALVLGAWKRSSLLSSVSINSFLAHSIEFDDWLRRGFVHAGSIVVPAALAAAQRFNRSIGEMLRAVAAGYEAAGLAGAFLGKRHYKLYHSTGTAGAVGAAASYALLAFDDPEEVLASAASIALAYAGGFWQAPRDPRVKPLSASIASTRGIQSAIAALSSNSRGSDIGDICKLLAGECNIDVLEEPPWDYAVTDNGYKLYPTCRHTHAAIRAALDLRRNISRASDVTSVVIETYSDAVRVASRWPIHSVYDARFSIEFLVAYSLIYGLPTVKGLARAINDSTVRRIAGITRTVPAEWADELYPEHLPAKVTIVTRDRMKHSSVVFRPPGDPGTIELNNILSKAHSLSTEAGDPTIKNLATLLTKSNHKNNVNEILINQINYE